MQIKVTVGKKFTVRVPNGRALPIESNFSGTQRPTVTITSSISYKPPVLSYTGQVAIIHFDNSTPIGAAVELLILENGEYLNHAFKAKVTKSKAFRNEVEDSYKLLFPSFDFPNALTFDQSYWTRGIGQIEILKKLRDKSNGELWKDFSLFAGVGFGGIQALFVASGKSIDELGIFWMGPLKKALSQPKSAITGQRSPAPIEKVLKKVFNNKQSKREMLLMDLKREVFIPLMDINGKCLAITKKAFPMMTVAEAAFLSCIDPLEFKTKPKIKGYSVTDSSFIKNPDTLLKVNSPRMMQTSIGSPNRMVNHGNKQRTLENMALINKEQSHRLTLMNQELGGIKRTRYECSPIDQFKKFDFSNKAINAAINSAFEVVK
jgi:hypothetical protein